MRPSLTSAQPYTPQQRETHEPTQQCWCRGPLSRRSNAWQQCRSWVHKEAILLWLRFTRTGANAQHQWKTRPTSNLDSRGRNRCRWSGHAASQILLIKFRTKTNISSFKDLLLCRLKMGADSTIRVSCVLLCPRKLYRKRKFSHHQIIYWVHRPLDNSYHRVARKRLHKLAHLSC